MLRLVQDKSDCQEKESRKTRTKNLFKNQKEYEKNSKKSLILSLWGSSKIISVNSWNELIIKQYQRTTSSNITVVAGRIITSS